MRSKKSKLLIAMLGPLLFFVFNKKKTPEVEKVVSPQEIYEAKKKAKVIRAEVRKERKQREMRVSKKQRENREQKMKTYLKKQREFVKILARDGEHWMSLWGLAFDDFLYQTLGLTDSQVETFRTIMEKRKILESKMGLETGVFPPCLYKDLGHLDLLGERGVKEYKPIVKKYHKSLRETFGQEILHSYLTFCRKFASDILDEYSFSN